MNTSKILAVASILCACSMGLAVAAASSSSPLDQTFGSSGVATLAVAGQTVHAFGGTAQTDGKAIVAGATTTSNGNGTDFFVARVGVNGRLDPAFGGSGELATDVAGLHQDDLADTATVANDGATLVGGSTTTAGGTYSAVVARYRPDGSLDTTFASNGFYIHAYPDGASNAVFAEEVSGIAVDSSGRIVFVVPDLDGSGFAVTRLHADGSVDTTFGTQGTVSVGCGCDEEFASTVLVQPDGKIDIGGSALGTVRVWRFTSAGLEDGVMSGPFDPNGSIATAWGMVEQPDGQIVVAGGIGFTGGASSNEAFALTRFTPDGQLDTSFGTDGIAAVQLGLHDDEAESLVANPDETLTAVGVEGVTETASTWTTRFAVVHFTKDGALDPKFGSTGVARGPGTGFATGAAILGDGRVYAFGYRGAAAQVMRFTAAPPAVAFTPGPVEAGDVVQVTTDDAAHISSVHIGGVVVPQADITVTSPSRFTLTVPDTVVTGKVTVTTPGGTATSATMLSVAPTVVSPNPSPPMSTGQSLVITGKNFTGATSVKVEGVPWAFHVNSPLQITATVPSSAIAGMLTVTTAGGDAGMTPEVCVQPQVTSVSPLTGKAGTVVSIAGSGLGNGPSMLGAFTSLGQEVSSTAHLMRVAIGDDVGLQPIVVQSCGDPVSYGQSFKAVPTITEIGAGTNPGNLRVLGSNFVGVTSLTFAGVNVPFTRVSATRLDVEATPAGADVGNWVVTTPAGRATFAFQAAPAIVSLRPSSGPTGTLVTVRGSAFEHTVQVILADGTHPQLSVPFTAVSSTEITFTVPSSAFSGVVYIRTAGGYSSDVVRLVVTPTISSLSPASGQQQTKLTIEGSGLASVNQVTFDVGAADAVTRSPDSVSPNAVTVYVPWNAHTGPIGVSGPDGSATSAKLEASGNRAKVAQGHVFTMTRAFYSVSPANVMPGDTVTITGVGFTGTTRVRFQGADPVAASGVTDTSVSAVVPSGAVRDAEVYLETSHGELDTGLGVLSVSATNGGEELGLMVLTGDGLHAVTTVDFTASGGGYTRSSNVESYLYGSDYDVRAAIPADAVTGPVRLGDAQGNFVTTQRIYVVMRITSVSEASWSPGDTVTITGSGLAGGSARLNGETCTLVSHSDTTVTFIVPADATNGHLVVFATAGSYDLGEFDRT